MTVGPRAIQPEKRHNQFNWIWKGLSDSLSIQRKLLRMPSQVVDSFLTLVCAYVHILMRVQSTNFYHGSCIVHTGTNHITTQVLDMYRLHYKSNYILRLERGWEEREGVRKRKTEGKREWAREMERTERQIFDSNSSWNDQNNDYKNSSDNGNSYCYNKGRTMFYYIARSHNKDWNYFNWSQGNKD